MSVTLGSVSVTWLIIYARLILLAAELKLERLSLQLKDHSNLSQNHHFKFGTPNLVIIIMQS